MDRVALLPANDRAALFGETGALRGVANTIIEKDFWVCWTLKRLFRLQKQDAATLVFKGGTSLSKAFGAIRRFSEDIDLSFDRAELGYTGDRDPDKEGISKKQANKLIEALVSDVERHIAEKLLPALRSAIVEQLGEPSEGKWSLEIDANDAQTVNFHYPPALASARGQRLTAECGFDSRLPFGGSLGRADWFDGRGMGTDRAAAASRAGSRLPPCSGQPTLFRRHDVDGAHGRAMATSA